MLRRLSLLKAIGISLYKNKDDFDIGFIKRKNY